MIRRTLTALINRDPFLPFQIKLVNGEVHQINEWWAATMLADSVYLLGHDDEWTEFPYDRICSFGSLLWYEP